MARHRSCATRMGFTSLLLAIGLAAGGCNLNSELAKRFRTAYVPGLMQGLSTAATDPAGGDTGLRQTLAALIDGFAAVLSPNTTTTGSGS